MKKNVLILCYSFISICFLLTPLASQTRIQAWQDSSHSPSFHLQVTDKEFSEDVVEPSVHQFKGQSLGVATTQFDDQLTNIPYQTTTKRYRDITKSIFNFFVLVIVVLVLIFTPVASLITIIAQDKNKAPHFNLLANVKLAKLVKPMGFVYDSETYEGVPFAVVNISSLDKEESQIDELVVTDEYGLYEDVNLPESTYKFEVSHQDYTFPSNKNFPRYLGNKFFYRGEPIAIESKSLFDSLLIPVDKKRKSDSPSPHAIYTLLLIRLSNLTKALIFPAFLLSSIFVFTVFNFFNFLVFLFYLLLTFSIFKEWFSVPSIKGKITCIEGKAIKDVVVKVQESATNELISIVKTDNHGKFKIYTKKGLFNLSLIKQKFILIDQPAMSLLQVDTRKSNQNLNLTMKKLE